MLLSSEEKKTKLKTHPEMFSRLLVAGIDVDELLDRTAFVIGAGGLGCLVAEMLARTGIGELIIVDRDTVKEGNFNRLGFRRCDIGEPKAKAITKNVLTLRNKGEIDESFHLKAKGYEADVIGWPKFTSLITKADVVFSCLDNSASRREANFHAMEEKTPLIDGATSHLGFGGTVITVVPDPEKPCYECLAGGDLGINVDTVPRIGHCDASLANVMSVVASIQVDQGLKLLLDYGKVFPLIKMRFGERTVLNEMKAKRRENCPVHQKIFGAEN